MVIVRARRRERKPSGADVENATGHPNPLTILKMAMGLRYRLASVPANPELYLRGYDLRATRMPEPELLEIADEFDPEPAWQGDTI